MNKFFVVFSMLVLGGECFAAADLTRVFVRQNWPWSREITVTYHLVGAEGAVDVNPAFFDGDRPLAWNGNGVKGDVYAVTGNRDHVFTIDPTAAFPDCPNRFKDFRVQLSPSSPSAVSTEVLYKVMELSSGAMKDITRAELVRGDYGAVETDFGAIGPGFNTTLTNVCIWTGITNNLAKYAGTHMVFRRIPAGTFKCSVTLAKTNEVTISKDYFIGVFKITYAQMSVLGLYDDSYGWDISWARYWGSSSTAATDYRPANGYAMRFVQGGDGQNMGTNNVNLAYVASATDNRLLPRLMSRVRQGPSALLVPFNVPSQARWLRALRAGTDTYYYDGLPTPENLTQNVQLDRLGLYRYNGGVTDNGDGTYTENGPCTVGRFLPNAFGLYDMLGNHQETSQDVYDSELSGLDPFSGVGVSYSAHAMMGTDYLGSAAILPPSRSSSQVHNHADRHDAWGVRPSFTADEVMSVAEYEKIRQ